MEKYIMALDQGTTSSRCIIYDRKGRIKSLAQKEFRQIYPKGGWVEHDAMEIWSSQLSVAQEAMAKINATHENIVSIGITNQRETAIVWDKDTGIPVYNAIVWQCRRTAKYCDELKALGLTDKIREKTGLLPDAYFSATKLRWILENVNGTRKKAEEGKLLFGTVETWLIWKLTGGKAHVTDYSNASRTMMFNINTMKWDNELLDIFEIPAGMLPEPVKSSMVFGKTSSNIFGSEIPIAGAAGDQQAALFGQKCFRAGESKMTYGTGGFMLMNTGTKPVFSKNGLITTVAWGIGDTVDYALEGSVFVAGASIQWLRDQVGLFDDSAASEKMALSVSDSAGCYFVPAFVGLGAPYWDPYARGTILGITRGTDKNHIVRAALESMAFQTRDLADAMASDLESTLTDLKADGGASTNDFLMQFQADILDRDVIRPACIETTSLGAAYLAGLSTGYWEDEKDIAGNCSADKRFKPSIGSKERSFRMKKWHQAVKCAMNWEAAGD